MNLDDLADIADQAVTEATALLRTLEPGRHMAKGDRDYATEADFAVEDHLRAWLSERAPHIPIVGEERSTEAIRDGLWWALDPIDGTVNFAHGLPLTAVSLALFQDDQPTIGVIDHPYLAERYRAVRGSGLATCNGERISVSSTSRLGDAVVGIGDYAVGHHANRKNEARLAITTALVPQVLRVRMLGASAVDLAWVARGRLDASITMSNKPWDTGAGAVIAAEAGAVVVDIDGAAHSARSTATIAAAPAVSMAVLERVRSAIPGP